MAIADESYTFDRERSKKDGAPGSGPVLRHWVSRSLEMASEGIGRLYLRRLTGIPDIARSVHAVPDRMQRTANQTRLVLELLEDVRNGVYHELSWYSVPVAAAAL